MWIPALSAIGAGFAIGLAAIGSGVGQASPETFGMQGIEAVGSSTAAITLRQRGL